MKVTNDRNMNPDRRRFIVSASGAVSVAALASLLPRMAAAAALPHVSPTDPPAKALGYEEDATKVKNAKYVAGSDCANCNFYKGDGKTEYGPCLLFPGKDVHSKGWCTSYVKKPK